MKANFHTHTTRCGHASGEDRQYVEEAIREGIKVLGFSDHSPYFFSGDYYSGFRMKREETEGYVNSVLSLKNEYKNDIEIKLGFETEYYPKYFDKLLKFYAQYPVDYIIMGQHFLYNEEEGIYTADEYKTGENVEKYVDQVIEGLSTGCFTYLAHPDLIRYSKESEANIKALHKLCEYMAKEKIPVEINLLGMRENRHYPTKEFFKIAAEHKCDVVIGCDAHSPECLSDTKTEEKALEWCKELGLNHIEYPELRKPCKKNA